jgi:hypothetical protein
MSSQFDFEGVYDKSKRYIVKNWSDEDFTQQYGAENIYNGDKLIESAPAYSITIKPGEIRELSQFEAYLFTRHFVDREMYKVSAKLTDKKEIEKAEMSVNNAEARKPYEDKTIEEIKGGQATSFMDKIREEIRKEELSKMKSTDINLPVDEKLIDKRTKEYKESLKTTVAEEFAGIK